MRPLLFGVSRGELGNGNGLRHRSVLSPPLMWSDPHQVCLEDYPIHTVTGLVKQWLRELPDPLMTFTHYNDFLHAVGEDGNFPHSGQHFF